MGEQGVEGNQVTDVTVKNSSQTRFIDDDQVIKALPSDTPYQPLHVTILPRGPIGGYNRPDAKRFDAAGRSFAEPRVAIPYQELEWFLVTERISQLLGGPFRRGVSGDVEVNDLPSVVRQEYKHMKKLEGNGRHNEEVEGDDL